MSYIPPNKFNEKVEYVEHGEWDPDLLSKILELSYSNLGAKTPQGKWQKKSLTVEQFLDQFRNFEIGEKDGKAILQGSLKGGARRASDMLHTDILLLDYDGGHNMETIINQIQDRGLAAFIYTTYNHGTTSTVISQKAIASALGKHSDPGLEDIKSYLIKKKQWCPKLVESVTIANEEGDEFTIKHDPIQKFRVVFFLKDRFLLDGMSSVLSSPLKEWQSRYKAVGDSFEIPYDQSCSDASRLMYTPRGADGTMGHKIIEIGGSALDLEAFDIPTISSKSYPNKGTIGKAIKTPGLKSFLNQNSDRFEAYDWIVDLDPSLIRNEKTDGSAEIECPFDEFHSNPGDPSDRGCWVANSTDSDGGHFQVKCLHNGCSDRTSAEFVNALCDRFGCDCDTLKNYLAERIVGHNGETEADTWELIKKLTNQTETDEISSICFMISGFKEELDQEKALKKLKEQTGLPLKSLRREFVKANRTRADEVADQSLISGLPIIRNSMNFTDQVNSALQALKASNDLDPKIFRQTGNHPVRLFKENSQVVLSPLGTKGLTTELSGIMLFEVRNSHGAVRQVAPFKDVVAHIEGLAPAPLPYLRHIANSPIFAANGSLQTEQGYDPETMCYINIPFELREVSDTPSEDEVTESRNLLLEAIEGFPFSDKFDGTEDLDVRVNGEPNLKRGESSRAGALAMILTSFMREMIAGPTPGFCIDKPKAGTGAGYLIDTAQIISNGERAITTPVSRDTEELRKVITSGLLSGNNYIFFDNINHHVDSGELASALTSSIWRDRILNRSEVTKIDISQMWIFAANNGSFSSELMRRMVPIRIDAGVVDPTKRHGFKHEDLHGWLFENRPKLVWACLTLIQNWISKGRQPGKVKLASFENWSSSLSGVLGSSGISGLLVNKEAYMSSRNQEDDSEIALVNEWWNEFTDNPVSSSQLLNEVVEPCELDLPIYLKDTTQRSRQLSFFIRQNIEGKIFEIESKLQIGGYADTCKTTVRCMQEGKCSGSKTWRLIVVK